MIVCLWIGCGVGVVMMMINDGVIMEEGFVFVCCLFLWSFLFFFFVVL